MHRKHLCWSLLRWKWRINMVTKAGFPFKTICRPQRVAQVQWRRSGHRRCSLKKVLWKTSLNSKKKKNGQSLFFNKVADLRPATLIKKKLRQACFLVNIRKFLRTPFFKEHLQWLVKVMEIILVLRRWYLF